MRESGYSVMSNLFAANLIIVMGLMLALWLIGTIRRDVSLVDLFWGTGFVVVAWITAWRTQNWNPPAVLILILTTVWGIRLSLYLAWRNWGHAEDKRYAAMRDYHGPRFWLVSLGTVFLLQGLIMWVIAMPVQVAVSKAGSFVNPVLLIAGVFLWLVGIVFESVGDWQLSRFKADPNNAHRVMDRGLWRYTRHPNYFGDFCVWWGIYLVSATVGAGWTIFSPILMSILLMRVSGVTLLESTITSRRPEYAEYQSRTSPFFPWKPFNSPAGVIRDDK